MLRSNSLPVLAGAAALLVTGLLVTPAAQAANIIGFANNATGCGGDVLCSTNGTTGYSGTLPFNLSTIDSWFQVDAVTSHLAGQPAQPKDAGNFLVINDTGHKVTSFSLTLIDAFMLATPGNQGDCGAGLACQNLQIHGGAANFFTTFTLTGADCRAHCGTDSADFVPGTVTYNWSGGTGVPIGATFDLNFASWNHDVFAVPAPLIGHGLFVFLVVVGVLGGGKLFGKA